MARTWHDDFTSAVCAQFNTEEESDLADRYIEALPEAYREDLPPDVGAIDVGRLDKARRRAEAGDGTGVSVEDICTGFRAIHG